MTEPLFSSSWYRVADLKPRLRSHATIHRHPYRGKICFTLQDHTSERFHQFSPSAYYIIGLMDGRRTVQELWDLATSHLGDEAPTQDQLIQLLGQLHSADVLQCEVRPDTAELFGRHHKQQAQKWQNRLFSVLSWRFSVMDPERLLQGLLPYAQPFFSWGGAIVWLFVVLPALFLMGTYWTDLTENTLDHILAPQNLLLLWILFPILKLFHELGHGLAIKAFGGEVHDIGIMILVLTPVPYVDASAAWGFHDKNKRMIVGAAGMMVELFIAALAFFLWMNIEPGITRTFAYNTILIASVSTLLFNANPLLRFDGYYIFSDFLEIPNLRKRANKYLGYLCERYLFGHQEAQAAPATLSERGWFVSYGVASFFYRILIVVGILLFLLDEFFALGVIFSVFGLVAWVFFPIGKGVKFLFTNPGIRNVHPRAILITIGLFSLLIVLIAYFPFPYRTTAEGVIWIPDEARVRAGTEGFVDRLVALPGSLVHPGDLLFECSNPDLKAKVTILEARLREIDALLRQEWLENRLNAAILQEKRDYIEAELTQKRIRLNKLHITSQHHGTFMVPNAIDLPGRFVMRGQELGYVIDFNTITIRAVVPQDDIDLVQYQTKSVHARLAENLSEITPSVIRRMVPTATDDLPSSALGSAGGGELATNPMETETPKAVKKAFHLDLVLPSIQESVNMGGRVYLLFDHGWKPLGPRWMRDLRQLFLSRFNV